MVREFSTLPCINHLSKYAEDKLFQYRARFNGTIISFHLSRLLKSGSFSFPSTLSFSTLFFRFSSSSFLTDLRGFRPPGYYIPRGKVHESNKRLDTAQRAVSGSSLRIPRHDQRRKNGPHVMVPSCRRSDEEFLFLLSTLCVLETSKQRRTTENTETRRFGRSIREPQSSLLQ